MFVKINKRVDKNGETTCTVSIVRSDRDKGKVVQSTVAYIGLVEEDKIPCLKAAYAKKKPRLVGDDDESPKMVGVNSNELELTRPIRGTRNAGHKAYRWRRWATGADCPALWLTVRMCSVRASM